MRGGVRALSGKVDVPEDMRGSGGLPWFNAGTCILRKTALFGHGVRTAKRHHDFHWLPGADGQVRQQMTEPVADCKPAMLAAATCDLEIAPATEDGVLQCQVLHPIALLSLSDKTIRQLGLVNTRADAERAAVRCCYRQIR